jgi:glycosyltransferase involved in cell wall biosynthesis
MIAIEAMACGTPVLALRQGGALDFIIPGKTGELFAEATVDSLASCIAKYKPASYDAQSLSAYAARYSPPAFLDKFRREIALLGTFGS